MAELIGGTSTSFLDVNQGMQLRLMHSVFTDGASLLRMLAKTDDDSYLKKAD